MTATDDSFTRVYHPTEISELLETLCGPGGASLVLERDQDTSLPVVIKAADAREALHLDISAVRDIELTLRRGNGFRISGLGRQGLVRTPVLTARRCREENRRLYCECNYPLYLEKMQRREAFRAPLRLDMAVTVAVRGAGDESEQGRGMLRDLSLKGCLVELEPTLVTLLDDREQPLELELRFPDDTRFAARARPCRQRVERGRIQCGFEFEPGTREQERQLWFLVREIEREAARAAAGDTGRHPSALFNGVPRDRSLKIGEYATPMARRLARSAGFLETQILAMREGGGIDPVGLSRHAERLLTLHQEDREELLFALVCLHNEPALIRHCLAVAVRLVDMGAALAMPPELCKALAAAGMVHDLGKALLPESVRVAPRLNAEQFSEVHNHVAVILERLADCHWLSPAVIGAVVEGANERLDGSGYPHHRSAAGLHELARLAATVDVIDAMGRARADRPGRPVDRIYDHLRAAPEQFDHRWVARYTDHFGIWPVGTLLRYGGGELGWVLGLNEVRRPSVVRIAESETPPDITAGTVLRGADLARLGEPVEVLVPPPEDGVAKVRASAADTLK